MAIVRPFHNVDAEPAAEGVTMRLLIGPSEGAPRFNMRVFEVQPGRATPHHQHWWEHEVFVLDGRGTLKSEGGEEALSPGTVVFVPGNEWHQFQNTGQELLRFLCLVPQEWQHGLAPVP
jgi:quercetin dioxygenase-like cupin family protein